MKGNKTQVHGHCLPTRNILVHPDSGNTAWKIHLGCQASVYHRKEAALIRLLALMRKWGAALESREINS